MDGIECIYWGIFFEKEDDTFFDGRLDRKIVHPHMTFGYKTPMPPQLLGKEASVQVCGYGNDGRNEALLVVWEFDDLRRYWNHDPRGHITLSVSENGRPVDSKNLNYELFAPNKRQRKVGRFGYFDGENVRFER